jgi:hypothetical protein
LIGQQHTGRFPKAEVRDFATFFRKQAREAQIPVVGVENYLVGGRQLRA